MLITLKYNFKITTPQIVDKYISAEIPDLSENRILHSYEAHDSWTLWRLVFSRWSVFETLSLSLRDWNG